MWQGEKIVPFSSSSSPSSPSSSSASLPASSSDTPLTADMILKANRDMLAAYCRSLKLKQSGRKDELTERILAYLKSNQQATVSSTPVVKTSSSSKKADKPDAPVLQSLKKSVAEFVVAKNRWGNFEHFATKFVFVNRIVVGTQMNDGHVAPLTPDDIEKCKREKLSFRTPEKLISDAAVVENIKLDDDDEEEEEELDDEIEMEEEVAEENTEES